MEDFHKFPRTAHVMNMGSASRDDLVMDKKDLQRFLANHVVIEEKIDGANLGISITEDYEIRFQNRSHYVTSESATQWKTLDQWKRQHQEALYSLLTPNLVLFGEWCYSKHSIHYTRLPDYFLAFDIYDKEKKKFLSVEKRDEMLHETGIRTVPHVGAGIYTPEQLQQLLKNSRSTHYDGPMEGLYLRIEKDGYLVERGKIVRADFLGEGDGEVVHWSKKELIKNFVIFE